MRANDADAPQWKRLYEAAIFELDPAKSIRRIAEARTAVLDQIEEDFSKPSKGEAFALGYALHMLTTLRHIAEGEIGERKRTGT